MAAVLSSASIVGRLAEALVAPRLSDQGRHPDPIYLPEPNVLEWEGRHGIGWRSAEMETFRASLKLEGEDIRDGILNDLSAYHDLSPETCREICIDWERRSIEEWKSADRSTAQGIIDFYDVAHSWTFDLLWYAYLQSFGHGLPASAMAAAFARACASGRSHLDFGSGVGVTSQLFGRLGFESTMADISRPMLDFAVWRNNRRGEEKKSINLRNRQLPADAYDVITAIDTLAHVPDFDAAAARLHRSLRPGGWLIANFDVRSQKSEGSAWHLYQRATVLDFKVQRAGFVRADTLGGVLHCYRKVDPDSAGRRARMLLQAAWLPVRSLKELTDRVRWPTPRRLKRLWRAASGRR
ncbi:class I SAM-dependent methyltransferase [Hansschlegelia quercus]|uniref:Class I SAM-dependent methyltransferase n=1 Tax=Hansschlegelia quercus TaxID=2528245 RepID=A0A4Q9GF28_9HYPH|nr:class I SAM-dependent methyltransferase [Hansschlegelia quercus]TBN47294.1 class I SAM-dependent methyltransferase [Hansschlegelia quercus]